MCGIGGFLRVQNASPDRQHEWLSRMGQSILHRGPDAGGVYLDDGVGLVHRRLSIIDLSEAGNQPMVSMSGRYVVVFNGEIYNFPEIRERLEKQGVTFRTHSDTEVLLTLYETEGERCLDELNGMFAIAIWDKVDNHLFLARDRLGKKPLYLYSAGSHFAFSSEIKALLELPFVKPAIRQDAVKDYFFYQYVPDGKSIFSGIEKLFPGECLRVDASGIHRRRYWDVSFDKPIDLPAHEIKSELATLIEDSVRIRMLSDVPLGAFLSGGVDSSAVVGLMAKLSQDPVVTCSIGFDTEGYDEVVYARQIANQFHTDHHEYTVRESVTDQFREIARYFDEPFADPSFIPTFYVSKLARQAVTVALAGDGGDENFAGYSKYTVDQTENNLRRWIPGPIRCHLFPTLLKGLQPMNQWPSRKAKSLLSALMREPDEGFFLTNAFFSRPLWDYLVRQDFERQLDGYDPASLTSDYYHRADTDDHLSRVLYTDIKTYLPGDILVKVDRMSMANSLETRTPLLDYRVVEYAARIPSSLKLRGRDKKHILKESMKPLLSDDILYRKKMGFSVPLAQWLRNELRATGDDYFNRRNSGLAEVFDMSRVRNLWQAHQQGQSLYTQELWSMLMYEVWWQNYVGAGVKSPNRELCA
ncbi:asparagine synthase (glutamine-hydrolyzing) [Saccharospirillum salsuginis]|uniref:asparagine synthase (glutamine-hydrolyzing) n=1 Tax=Saccharospirillum salsuginis TaxID=418750 RepID=A0A918N829_9GAMM|nr:asparagine synthase (glutamine-hydrolyzing) [Saccharospirillum salsuginis]GGX49585.1 amidotransferase 1, exosortase A system-associated [Saccharospirillum salsuginis]